MVKVGSLFSVMVSGISNPFSGIFKKAFEMSAVTMTDRNRSGNKGVKYLKFSTQYKV